MKPSLQQNLFMDFILKTTSLDIGIMMVDLQMNILHFSEAFKELCWPVEADKLMDSSQLYNMASLCLQQKKSVSGLLLHEVYPGEFRNLLVFVYPYTEDQKNSDFPFLVILLCDVSSMHNQYESRLQNENRKLIGDMAAGSANFILNPLAVIKGSLQLIQKNLQTASFPVSPHITEQMTKHVSLAGNQVEQIHHHIQRLLLIGKPIIMELHVTLLTSFLEDFIPLIQREAVEQNLTLICEYPNREANLFVHPIYLKQVLHEIVRNSFEASKSGDKIYIGVEVKEASVIFSLSDIGCGIPNEIIAQVRLPFFTTKEHSLGLGLNFCDTMLQKMEGNLEIQSSLGKTTVTVTLPRISDFLGHEWVIN